MAQLTTGQAAERLVADHLKALGYKILDRNWKTRLCEIDIVCQRDTVIYFIEVKYRQNFGQGTGFEYILPRKLGQIEFAARLWCQQHRWDGDWRLMAASVSGEPEQDIDLVEIF